MAAADAPAPMAALLHGVLAVGGLALAVTRPLAYVALRRLLVVMEAHPFSDAHTGRFR